MTYLSTFPKCRRRPSNASAGFLELSRQPPIEPCLSLNVELEPMRKFDNHPYHPSILSFSNPTKLADVVMHHTDQPLEISMAQSQAYKRDATETDLGPNNHQNIHLTKQFSPKLSNSNKCLSRVSSTSHSILFLTLIVSSMRRSMLAQSALPQRIGSRFSRVLVARL